MNAGERMLCFHPPHQNFHSLGIMKMLQLFITTANSGECALKHEINERASERVREMIAIAYKKRIHLINIIDRKVILFPSWNHSKGERAFGGLRPHQSHSTSAQWTNEAEMMLEFLEGDLSCATLDADIIELWMKQRARNQSGNKLKLNFAARALTLMNLWVCQLFARVPNFKIPNWFSL